MVNFLKDVSLDTFIGELPSIINFNNNSIEQEFNVFYDSSEGRLIRSVYVPNGTVQSHWGRFTNLEAEYVKFSNRDSLSQALENAKLEHNIFVKKFRNDWIDSSGSTTYDTFNNDFCHDPGVISSGVENNSTVVSLEDRLRVIEASLGISYALNASSMSEVVYNKEMTKEEEYVKVLQNEPDYYFYSEDYLTGDLNTLPLRNENDKTDLERGQIFNYYTANEVRFVKIDNSRPAYIYDFPKDSTLDIIFTQTFDSNDDPINEPIYIILTREGAYNILKIENTDNDYSAIDLVKVQLIKVNSDKWSVSSYSLPSSLWTLSYVNLNDLS